MSFGARHRRTRCGLVPGTDEHLLASRFTVDSIIEGLIESTTDESTAALDVVVASVHSKLSMPRDEMTRRMVMAVASPHVDILGHCTGRKVVGRGRPASTFDAELVFAACAQALV